MCAKQEGAHRVLLQLGWKATWFISASISFFMGVAKLREGCWFCSALVLPALVGQQVAEGSA